MSEPSRKDGLLKSFWKKESAPHSLLVSFMSLNKTPEIISLQSERFVFVEVALHSSNAESSENSHLMGRKQVKALGFQGPLLGHAPENLNTS